MANKIEKRIKNLLFRKISKRGITDMVLQQEYLSDWFEKYRAARRRKLARLWFSQEGKCIYCKCQTWIVGYPNDGPQRFQATTEHVIPVTLGGTDNMSNLAMSCYRCNKRRGVIEHSLFIDVVLTGKLDNTGYLKKLNREVLLESMVD